MEYGIIEQLQAIADANPRLLIAYKKDLHIHDARTLAEARPGERHIWVLRQCGTALYRLGSDLDPLWYTFWLDGPGYERGTLSFLLEVGENGQGTVRPIPTHKACRLARGAYQGVLKRKEQAPVAGPTGQNGR